MKKITLSVDEAVLAVVRRYAVEIGSSINALVREFLAGISEREARAQRTRRRLRGLSERSSARIGSASWARAELPEG
jgi:hypothetical protein